MAETIDYYVRPTDGWVQVASDAAAALIAPSSDVPYSLLVSESAPVTSYTAATGALTFSDPAEDGETVTIGGRTYTFVDALTGDFATGVLTFSGRPEADETVTVGDVTYTFVAALSEASAVGVLTFTGQPAAGSTFTINDQTYTFVAALSNPPVANEILRGASLSAALDNAVVAINAGAGAGTVYSALTVQNPLVSATKTGSNDELTVTAREFGFRANGYETTEAISNASWGAVHLEGGVDVVPNEILRGANLSADIDNLVSAANGTAGEGTTYSTDTVPLALFTASKTGTNDEFTITADAMGVAANDVVTDTDVEDAAWGAEETAGGVDTVPYEVVADDNAEDAIINLTAAVNADPGDVGTLYSVGTERHPTVSGADTSATVFTATARSAGTVGNSIATTETVDDAAWGAGFLTGGADPQVGASYGGRTEHPRKPVQLDGFDGEVYLRIPEGVSADFLPAHFAVTTEASA